MSKVCIYKIAVLMFKLNIAALNLGLIDLIWMFWLVPCGLQRHLEISRSSQNLMLVKVKL